MKSFNVLSAITLLVAACAPASKSVSLPHNSSVTSPPVHTMAPQETPDLPITPAPDDLVFQGAKVYINQAEILIRESFPLQIALVLRGELPTPCHQLRVEINQPDAENKIRVDAYSVENSQKSCIQILKKFEENIDLGSFPSGHYTVWVNDIQVGEFDS